MWADFAPGKGKPNEEQMRKLEELWLKLTEGKPNEEQTKEIAEQIEEYIETQTQKTAEVGEVSAGDRGISASLVQRSSSTCSARFEFRHQTSAQRQRALRGQRRFVWRGRHADLLVSAKGLEELSSHLCRSFGP